MQVREYRINWEIYTPYAGVYVYMSLWIDNPSLKHYSHNINVLHINSNVTEPVGQGHLNKLTI